MTGRMDTVPGVSDSDRGERPAAPRMWRAAWRQHRYWVLGTVALVAAGGLALALIVLLIPACASTAWWETPGATCDLEPANTLWSLYRLALVALPVITGLVLGAVTFGPDKEHRTQVYALTQGVSRIRWWAGKVLIMTVPVVVAAAVLGTATLWVVDASDDSVIWAPRITWPDFDILGLMPASRFLVAFAAAAAAALIWRTVGGIVAGLVVAGVMVAGSSLLQPLVVPHARQLIPMETWWNDDTGYPVGGMDSAYGWSGYTDADGVEIDPSSADCANNDFPQCLQDVGVVYRLETYVADAEYTQMTLIITGINLSIAAGLLAAGAQALRRRDLSAS